MPRVNGGTAGGSVAWNADGTGFYYTRYPPGNERPKADLDFYQQVYFHKLGTPTDEGYLCHRQGLPPHRRDSDCEPIEGPLHPGHRGQWRRRRVRPLPARPVRQVGAAHEATPTKSSARCFGRDDALYLLSRAGSPAAKFSACPWRRRNWPNAKMLVPQTEATIERFVPTATRLYVVDLVGGPSQVRVFDLEGKERKSVPVRPVASVGQVVRLEGDDVLFRTETFIDPPAWFRYDPATDKATKTALFRTSPADFSDCEVVREFAVSKDGTKVPMNIIRRKGTKLDGNNPTLLNGYGGYGISLTPRFRVGRKVWLEQGGVIAIANLRGGGEYGEAWHHAGNLTKKQNVFDDFIACARHLIQQKYTNPEKLAIEGGSNGGLLMGAALTQQPGLVPGRRVARRHLRHAPRGTASQRRLQRDGVRHRQGCQAVRGPVRLFALPPRQERHRLSGGLAADRRERPARGPGQFAEDDRLAAGGHRIEAAGLVANHGGAGHGLDSSLSERIAQEADVYAFLFDQLGVKYKAHQ